MVKQLHIFKKKIVHLYNMCTYTDLCSGKKLCKTILMVFQNRAAGGPEVA